MGVNFRKRQSIILAGVYRVIPDLDRSGYIPARAPHGRSGMFLTRWNGARPRTAWECGRLARRQQCAAFWARGHRALGRLTRAGRPPGGAGVSSADSSVTHHGSEGIVPSAASRGWNALLGARASRPREQCDLSRDQGHCALGRLTRAGRPARRLA